MTLVVWVIGLAGAGKTSIGRELARLLRRRRPGVVFLDGDDIREIMGADLGHTLEDRLHNAWRICRLCRYLDRQEIDVVCAILSLFEQTREWNRAKLSRYFEVYLDVPLAELEARDQKGLYSGARAGTVRNVAGVDLPFAPPARPDLVLPNGSGAPDVLRQADRILAAIDERFG